MSHLVVETSKVRFEEATGIQVAMAFHFPDPTWAEVPREKPGTPNFEVIAALRKRGVNVVKVVEKGWAWAAHPIRHEGREGLLYAKSMRDLAVWLDKNAEWDR